MLSAGCDCFDDMFSSITPPADGSDELPRVTMFEDAETIALLLPLAYRQSGEPLRKLKYRQLEKCIRMADKLGMPLAVDLIGIYLEA